MKIKGTDYGIKHINIKEGDKRYMVAWKYDIIRGVRVTALIGFSQDAVVEGAFPPLPGVIGEMLMRYKNKRLQRIGINIADRFRYVYKQPPISVRKI